MSNQSGAVISLREESNATPTLDDRIADAFEATLSASELKALVAEVERANAEARALSEQAGIRAIDPKVRRSEVDEARRQMEDANFRSNRMDAAADQLNKLHAKALSREAAARAAAEYQAAKDERDSLVADLPKYEAHAKALAELLHRLSSNDERIRRANVGQSAETWLYSAEQIARGASKPFDVHLDETLPGLLSGVRLPNFRRSGINGYVWPPARGKF